jgi:RimJ/RimL family protein N-acetyltransferase
MAGESFIADVLKGRRTLHIEVRDECGAVIGSMAPVSAGTLADHELLSRITAWRNNAKEHFFMQGTLTIEQTEEWVRKSLLMDHRRLLFLIYAGTKAIGTVGFSGLNERSAELGNLVRGEVGGGFKLMQCAHRALIAWLFETFKIATEYAMVLADNPVAINHLRRLGFVPTEETSLSRHDDGRGVYYVPDARGTIDPTARRALRMELTRVDWLRQVDAEPETIQPSWYLRPRLNAN